MKQKQDLKLNEMEVAKIIKVIESCSEETRNEIGQKLEEL